MRLEDDIGRNPEQWTAVERDLWETYNKAEKKARGERMTLEAARDAKEANLFVPPDPLQDE